MDRFLLFMAFLCASFAWAQEDFETIGILPAEVSETSGLIFMDGQLITHNDSGNLPVLFEIDTVSLAITRTVTIENVNNIDWEDLAQDSLYIYIADFGNNVGSRQDLAIYRISKDAYRTQNSVTAETIEFSYSDQTNFSGAQLSDFDAEALIVLGDQLLVFTKQWQSNGTVVYTIPKEPGNYVAQPGATYFSDGLITGATYDDEQQLVLLSGYSQQLQPFLIYTEVNNGAVIFNTSTTRYNLPVGFAQVEGITKTGSGRFMISSEKFTNANPPVTLDQSLFAFNFGSQPDPDPDPGPNPDPDPTPDPDEEPYREGVVVFSPRDSDIISYDLFGDRQLFGRAIFDTSGRLIQYTKIQDIESNDVDVLGLRSGVYYLTFYLRGLTISEPFIIK